MFWALAPIQTGRLSKTYEKQKASSIIRQETSLFLIRCKRMKRLGKKSSAKQQDAWVAVDFPGKSSWKH